MEDSTYLTDCTHFATKKDKFERLLSLYYAKNDGKKVVIKRATKNGTKKAEVLITSVLANALEGRAEVKAPYGLGRADVLSKDILIESKYSGSTSEKNALGQLLVYKRAFKFKGALGLAIIGDPPIEGIRMFCKEANIIVFWYNLNTYKWSII